MARRKNKRKILLGALRAALIAPRDIDFLFLDNFSIADAAPLADPLPADVLGSWNVVVDTNGDALVGSGQLELYTRFAAGDPRLNARDADDTETWVRAAGLAAFFRVLTPAAADGHTRIGWDNAQTGNPTYEAFKIQHDGVLVADRFGPVPQIASGLDDDVAYDYALVLRATGAFWYIKGGSEFPAWSLLFVEDDLTATPLYFGVSPGTVGMTRGANIHSARVTQLPAAKIPSPALSDNFGTIPTIADSGSNGFDGTPVRVGLSGSEASFDGSNSVIDIYSAALNTAFDPDNGMMFGRFKVPSDVSWIFNDATNGVVTELAADASNYIRIKVNTLTQVQVQYTAAGTVETNSFGGQGGTDYISFAGVWDTGVANEFRSYENGGNEKTTTTLGVWAGALLSTRCAIGAELITPTQPYQGLISDVIWGFGTSPSAAQIATIDTKTDAGTLTTSDLDTIFGAGNWAWYQLDEQYTSDGLGHLEADGGGANKTQLGPTVSHAANKAYIAPLGGDEIIVNGGMDADTNWSKGTGWTIAAGVASKASGTASNLNATVPPLTVGGWFVTTFTVSNYVAGNFSNRYGGTNGVLRSANGTFTETAITDNTNYSVRGDATADGDIDDVTSQQLALADILGLYQGSSADVYLRDDLTITDDFQAGLSARWDSATAPASGIIVYFDRGATEQIVVGKYVSGTYTEVSATAATYSAGAKLEVRCIGSEVHVIYNGAHVVTDTISDSEITANVLHGIFGTENATTHETVHKYITGAIDYSPYLVGA
jgi:hypothetical protein